jgi:peptidoglycan hydrolase-like protein with peptidoglycan-binding domain
MSGKQSSLKQSFFVGSLAVVLIGWAASAGAQTNEPMKLPPLPSANGAEVPTGTQAAKQGTQQQAAAAPDNGSTNALPPLPLDHDGIHEVQSQLIALGFDPGPADGETGPGTMRAVTQYNESRGGTGPVPVDGRLLARLQQDTGPRLTPRADRRALASTLRAGPRGSRRRHGAAVPVEHPRPAQRRLLNRSVAITRAARA